MSVKTTMYAIALWLLCGLIGEMLLRDSPHLDGILLGAVTLGEGIRHFVRG